MSETVELFGEIRHQTENAILFFDGTQEVWIPKSQISEQTEDGGSVEIEIPVWLATQKGLV